MPDVESIEFPRQVYDRWADTDLQLTLLPPDEYTMDGLVLMKFNEPSADQEIHIKYDSVGLDDLITALSYYRERISELEGEAQPRREPIPLLPPFGTPQPPPLPF